MTGRIDRYDFRGRTDQRIVFELLSDAGLDEALIRARLQQCFDVYVEELDRDLLFKDFADVASVLDALTRS